MSSGNEFDMEYFISYICQKLRVVKIADAYMVMLRWLEVIHSLPSTPIFRYTAELLPILLGNLS